MDEFELRHNKIMEDDNKVDRNLDELWAVSSGWVDGYNVETPHFGVVTLHQDRDSAEFKLEMLKKDCINYWASKYFVIDLHMNKTYYEDGIYIRYEVSIDHLANGKILTTSEVFEARRISVEPKQDTIKQ